MIRIDHGSFAGFLETWPESRPRPVIFRKAIRRPTVCVRVYVCVRVCACVRLYVCVRVYV